MYELGSEILLLIHVRSAYAMKLVVKLSTGAKFDVDAEDSITVEELKALTSQQADIPATQIRLIFKGHVLKDPQTLSSYGQ